ncbi:hypothetical protein D3C85_1465440 [compost metagenome]
MQALDEQRMRAKFDLPSPPVYLALHLMGHQRFTTGRVVGAFIKQRLLPRDSDIPQSQMHRLVFYAQSSEYLLCLQHGIDPAKRCCLSLNGGRRSLSTAKDGHQNQERLLRFRCVLYQSDGPG